MYIFKIVKSHTAVRCEVCHKTDCYDTVNNFCSRCMCSSTEELSYRTINNITVNSNFKTYHSCAKCKSTDVYPRSGICKRCGFIQDLSEINTACIVCHKSKRVYVNKKCCVSCSISIFKHIINNITRTISTRSIEHYNNECTVCHKENINSIIGICQCCKDTLCELTFTLVTVGPFFGGIILLFVSKLLAGLLILSGFFLFPTAMLVVIGSNIIEQIFRLYKSRVTGIDASDLIGTTIEIIVHSGVVCFLGLILWSLIKSIFLR